MISVYILVLHFDQLDNGKLTAFPPFQDLSLLAGDGQVIFTDKLQLSPLTKSFQLAKISKFQYFVVNIKLQQQYIEISFCTEWFVVYLI